MARIKTEGKCVYCDKTYTGQGISRHLNKHLESFAPVNRKRSFHLKVKASPYFLNILVDGDAVFSELDSFLRQIWLECCGHLSQFGFERWNEDTEIKMATKIRRVFDKGVGVWYVYDYGSSTELVIECMDVFPIATPEKIKLLSRNEFIKYTCESCNKKTAVLLCSVHWGEEASVFCESCGEKHEQECEDAEYAMASLYNSPRAGVCAYEGGIIDTERDGV